MADYNLIDQNFLDGVEMNRQYPETFEIPAKRRIDSLERGDFIKVGFIGQNEDQSANTTVERMWLIVMDYYPITGLIRGELNNGPVLFTQYNIEDRFVVHKDHVLSIMKKRV